MLRQLEIKNLGIIEHQSLELEDGFTVITGETGSGKSMLLGAIEMLTGEKVSKDKIRKDTNKAVVQALFDLREKDKENLLVLQEEGLFDFSELLDQGEEAELFLTRELKTQGSVCRIAQQMVPQNVLKQVSKQFIDIHGQRENQKIFEVKTHERLLDAYGKEKILPFLQAYEKDYLALEEILQEKSKLDLDENTRKEKISYARYQLKEIQELAPKLKEDDYLEKQIKQLSTKSYLAEHLQTALDSLTENEDRNSYFYLQTCISALSSCLESLPKLQTLIESLREAGEKIQSVSQKLYRGLENLDVEEGKLETLENRLASIEYLKRKHGGSIEKILLFAKEKKEEIAFLVDAKERLETLEEEEKKAEEKLLLSARQLHEARLKVAQDLTQAINKELTELSMPLAKFKVDLLFEKIEKRKKTGLDKIEFFIEANAGEGYKALAQTASGGEASRIMLAIKVVLAKKDSPMLLIFDEVDAGVSGEAAAAVGEKLKKLSQDAQVICVTHSAYIASMANAHIKIYKEVEDGRSQSKLKVLNESEREEEISTLLSGNANKEDSLRLAKALLAKAKK